MPAADLLMSDPYDQLMPLVVDAKDRFLGEVPLYKRVTPVVVVINTKSGPQRGAALRRRVAA